MSTKSTQLLEEAPTLPLGDRAELADRLLTSLDASSDAKVINELWAQEAENRIDTHEQGDLPLATCHTPLPSLRSLK